MSRVQLQPLDPGSYVRHTLHQGDRPWVETNCFVDLWIEILHAHGLEPLASLGCTLDIDFEGDQFTFYKQTYADLEVLYGVDLQELNVWMPLQEHAVEFLRRRRLVLTEADAFWMPDTAGTDYRAQHTKSTIGIQSIDLEAERLGYFHNAGYHELSGEDFRALFRIGADPDPSRLPLYCEFLRVESLRVLPSARLASLALERTRAHWLRRPPESPTGRFAVTFPSAVEAFRPEDLPRYHLYAFATLRQLGSAADLGAHHLRWLGSMKQGDFARPAAALDEVSNACKSLILKGARAVVSGRHADFLPLLEQMTSAWDGAMDGVREAFGS